MLRSHQPQFQPDESKMRGDPLNAFPGLDEPYSSQDRALGVVFYQAKRGFFLPYHALQSMEFSMARIALEFPGETVVILGRGLHALAVGLAPSIRLARG